MSKSKKKSSKPKKAGKQAIKPSSSPFQEKDFLSIKEAAPGDLEALFRLADRMKKSPQTYFNVLKGKAVYEECLKKKLLINCTQGNVLRLMPALVVREKEIDRAVGILDQALTMEEEKLLTTKGSVSP